MGRNSISEWSWAMEQHKKKGHQIIKYPEADLKVILDAIDEIKPQKAVAATA